MPVSYPKKPSALTTIDHPSSYRLSLPIHQLSGVNEWYLLPAPSLYIPNKSFHGNPIGRGTWQHTTQLASKMLHYVRLEASFRMHLLCQWAACGQHVLGQSEPNQNILHPSPALPWLLLQHRVDDYIQHDLANTRV